MTRTDVISVCGVWEDAIHQTSPLLPTDFSAGAQSRGWEETFERRLKSRRDIPLCSRELMMQWIDFGVRLETIRVNGQTVL